MQLANEALASKPAVVMGSSIVAMCLAMAPLMESGPMHYCLSPAIHPKPGSYTFSASSDSVDQIAAVMRYYRMKGWTKLAVLDTTDASGQDGDRAVDQILDYPENKGVMTKVIQEHFNPTDISVAAQIKRIKASGELETRIGQAAPVWLLNFSRVVGTIAIAIGLILLVLALTAYFD